jgi:hypothetical protein
MIDLGRPRSGRVAGTWYQSASAVRRHEQSSKQTTHNEITASFGDDLEQIMRRNLAVEDRIAAACARAGRTHAAVLLFPVTKTVPFEILRLVGRVEIFYERADVVRGGKAISCSRHRKDGPFWPGVLL